MAYTGERHGYQRREYEDQKRLRNESRVIAGYNITTGNYRAWLDATLWAVRHAARMSFIEDEECSAQ